MTSERCAGSRSTTAATATADGVRDEGLADAPSGGTRSARRPRVTPFAEAVSDDGFVEAAGVCDTSRFADSGSDNGGVTDSGAFTDVDASEADGSEAGAFEV